MTNLTDEGLRQKSKAISHKYLGYDEGESSLNQAIFTALQQVRDAAKKEALLKVDEFWRFDENQQPMSSWYDKQDCLTAIRQMEGGK